MEELVSRTIEQFCRRWWHRLDCCVSSLSCRTVQTGTKFCLKPPDLERLTKRLAGLEEGLGMFKASLAGVPLVVPSGFGSAFFPELFYSILSLLLPQPSSKKDPTGEAANDVMLSRVDAPTCSFGFRLPATKKIRRRMLFCPIVFSLLSELIYLLLLQRTSFYTILVLLSFFEGTRRGAGIVSWLGVLDWSRPFRGSEQLERI